MAYAEFLPDPRLRPLVRGYWQVSEFHEPQDEEHRFMPERSLRLTFYAGQSWQSVAPGDPLTLLPAATLLGLTLAPQRVVSVGWTRALGVELYPWGARQLFGWTAEQQVTDLTAAYPALSRSVSALLALDAWEEAREQVEVWLLKLLEGRGQPLTAGIQAAGELYRSLGTVRIGTLAAELGLSPRHLERQFVQEVGVQAKTLARLIRFEEVHNRLWLNPGTPLVTLAYDLGFSDQAHLTREFRSLAGMPPGAFSRYAAQEVQRRPIDEREMVRLLQLGEVATAFLP